MNSNGGGGVGGDSLSMGNAKASCGSRKLTEDQISLRSLPAQNAAAKCHAPQSILSGCGSSGIGKTSTSHPPRSVSPMSSHSGDELLQGGAMRRSSRYRRLNLDKQQQISENSSLLSMDDYGSERVRFDENVSFINDATNNNNKNNSLSEGGESRALEEGTQAKAKDSHSGGSVSPETKRSGKVDQLICHSEDVSSNNNNDDDDDGVNVTIVKI
eukprot:TRINITY_DN5939_c0_g1_i3.p1 TRINITY_DN5939_c0_g1~~TRINITY_DN5939_c0_g1_i3.p1  ORF type:complete len:214 (+),score=66.86 TRINITY_DN5939_c0_g1_i3:249-890(+)